MATNRTTCQTCRFTLKNPILQLPSTNWGFYNDTRFPGRTILALKPHREDLSALAPHLMTYMFTDLQIVIRTMQQALKTNRIELLFPKPDPLKPFHLHIHLIPYPVDGVTPEHQPAVPPRPSQLFTAAQTQAHISVLLSHYHKNNPEPLHKITRTVAYTCKLCGDQYVKPEHEETLLRTLIVEHINQKHLGG